MESIKNRIKYLARSKNRRMEEVAENLKITSQGMYKSFGDKTIKLKQLENISEFLDVHVTELLPTKQITPNIVSESTKNYEIRSDKNNYFSDSKETLVRLKTENEQFKGIIDKQDKEIEFLRGQLQKR